MSVNKFIGCQYPLIKSARGIFAHRSGVNQIKADLLQLLLTNPGERVMLPTYGTPLRQLMFEPNDSSLELRARQMINDAILAWEPRIVIQNIEITSKIDRSVLSKDDSYDEQEAILYIKVSFVDPENIQEVEVLELHRPLGA